MPDTKIRRADAVRLLEALSFQDHSPDLQAQGFELADGTCLDLGRSTPGEVVGARVKSH